MVYLIDASALVLFFLKNPAKELAPARTRIVRLITSWRKGSNTTFYVPNFCMAECSKAFSKLFIDGDEDPANYRRHIEALLELVSSKKQNLIKTYKLKREHLVDVEDVFIADRRIPLRDNEKPLSGFDGLIIAMGRTLRKSHPRVYIITAEKRMAKIANSDAALFPPAVCIIKDEIPGL